MKDVDGDNKCMEGLFGRVLLDSKGRRMQLPSYGEGNTLKLGEYPETAWFSERWQGWDVQRTECVRVSGRGKSNFAWHSSASSARVALKSAVMHAKFSY